MCRRSYGSLAWYAFQKMAKFATTASKLVTPGQSVSCQCGGAFGAHRSVVAPPLQTWLRSVLLANVGGVSREDIYENIIEIFDNFHKHGFMPTMDYRKVFDCLDSDLSCSLLRAHGWPLDLIHLLEATWCQQERFVQWDHHTHMQAPWMRAGFSLRVILGGRCS